MPVFTTVSNVTGTVHTPKPSFLSPRMSLQWTPSSGVTQSQGPCEAVDGLQRSEERWALSLTPSVARLVLDVFAFCLRTHSCKYRQGTLAVFPVT